MLQLESRIVIDAAGLPSDDYFTLLSLATRLAYSSAVLTVGEGPDGTLDPTDVMMFMRDSGAPARCVRTKYPHTDIALNFTKNSHRVNPVEALYAAFPMFMYFDPDLGGLLLEPLLRYQSSNFYTQPYAAPDAGELYLSNSACVPPLIGIRFLLPKHNIYQ